MFPRPARTNLFFKNIGDVGDSPKFLSRSEANQQWQAHPEKEKPSKIKLTWLFSSSLIPLVSFTAVSLLSSVVSTIIQDYSIFDIIQWNLLLPRIDSKTKIAKLKSTKFIQQKIYLKFNLPVVHPWIQMFVLSYFHIRQIYTNRTNYDLWKKRWL